MSKSQTRTLALMALLLLALMSAGSLLQPPMVRASGKADQFDARAAQARLVRILGDQAPHPVDSAASDAVRARLLTEIQALGLAPNVQDTFSCRGSLNTPDISCARVRNIVFETGAAPHILAVSHYDSVAAGPGASDAGIGVAAWLEIARIAKNENRAVRFLLTEGEEAGLLGAEAFVRDAPRMQGITALINLDARGTKGPALFFETNRPNANAVRAYGSAPRPAANAIMADVYRLLPNSTDVSVLKKPGMDVINIALLDGFENYHTPRDSLANADWRSLQHMGDGALAALRGFDAPADQGNASFAYADIASRAFIALPEWTARFGLIVGVVILAFFVLEHKAATPWAAIASPLIAFTVMLLLSYAGGAVLSAARPGAYWFAHPEISRFWCGAAALAGIALALMRFGSGASAALLHGAAMLWFAVIGLAGSLALPGLPILFAPPLLIACAGVLASLRWPRALIWSAWASGIAALIMWGPLVHLAELALGYEYPAAVGALADLALLPWIGVLAAVQDRASWRPIALISVAGFLIGLVAAASAPSRSPQRPSALNINYVLDAGADQARFAAGSAVLALPENLRMAAPFAPNTLFAGDRQKYWTAPAPHEDLTPPRLRLVSQKGEEGRRVLRFRLASHDADRIALVLPHDAIKARVNGAEAFFGKALSPQLARLSCQGRACDQADITLTLPDGDAPIEISLMGQHFGAAAAAQSLIAQRPESAVPYQSGDGRIALDRMTITSPAD